MSTRLNKFASFSRATASGTNEPEAEPKHLKLLYEFRDIVKRDIDPLLDLSTIGAIVDALKHPDGIDDRKMLLEKVLVFLSKLPPGSFASDLKQQVIKLLYDDLGHPPETLIGPKYAFRTADGSYNNVADPDLGKAGMPYARSVQQTHPLPRNELPDAGLVFDTLLKRESFEKHPAGLSSMFFSFAALVIHTVFRTSHRDVNKNDTSSYVDLAPLYGNDVETQKKIRVFDGRGLLHPDVFAEDRLLLLPPAVCTLLVLFNRNHNYIARKLLELNERGTWVDPTGKSPNEILKQEEEIFQIARLCNCAWFAGIVFSDYFSNILGLVREGSTWSLTPFDEIRNEDHSLFERGRGNVCSVEFNCLYRWHATTSEADEQWITGMFQQLFKGKSLDTVTVDDFKNMAQEVKKQEPDLTHWTFGTIQRQDDNTFSNKDLGDIIKNATDHPAAAFKARGTPSVMRLHEVMGIESNRQWGVCSLNDFRKFLGLKTYASFLEWNPDPEVAAAAEKLYGTIDRLELYVGLQAEAAKPKIEGAGLCPSYTISRAILSDAIALTRGDRFYTADFTPFNMTCWGFADCQRDTAGPGFGSMLGRLILRTLPDQFPSDSTYTWFPLMTPDAMREVLTNLKMPKTYDFVRPGAVSPTAEVREYRDVAQVLGGGDLFNVRWKGRASNVISGPGFFMAAEKPSRAAVEQRAFLEALNSVPGMDSSVGRFFFTKTRELMLKEAFSGVGSATKSVDIVRDVLRQVPVLWASEVIGISLKSSNSAKEGVYTPGELFDMLAEIYSFLFLDIEAEKLISLEKKVQANIESLLQVIKNAVTGKSRFSLEGLAETVSSIFYGQRKSDKDIIAERLSGLGYSSDAIYNMLLAFLVGSTVETSQALINIVNFYLDENKPRDLQVLVSKSTLFPEDLKTFKGLVNEALRLDPPFRGVYRQALSSTKVGTVSLKPEEVVFVDIASASLDPNVFPDPNTVNPSRNQPRYLVGDGIARCLGPNLAYSIFEQTIRSVFGWSKVQRAPGQSGTFKRYQETSAQTSTWSYLGPDQLLTPWATSMIIQFEQ